MSDSISEALRPVLAAERPDKLQMRFGTDDPVRLGAWLEQLCETDLGDALCRLEFTGGFAAGVFGLILESGRRIVVKIHTDRKAIGHLSCAYDLQEKLRQKGIPCAARLLPLKTVEPVVCAAVHEHFASGSQEDCANPGRRRQVAEALARIVESLRGEPAKRLHEITFHEVDVTAGPSKRLGAIHNRARAEIRRGDAVPVVAHTDIKARNLLFKGDRVSAVYDFESLSRAPESVVVGATSVDFMSDRGQMKLNFDPEVALGFVRDYEAARGTRFSKNQMGLARAGAVFRLSLLGAHFLAAGTPESRLTAAVEAFESTATRRFR